MKKILVIEDEKDLRNNLTKIFKMSGYSVVAAAGGEEGIMLASKELPDLILCDVMMPGIDGYQVLKRLSKIDKVKKIPFVFLTAKVELSDLRNGMALGADDYIFKPFRVNELISAVESRLKRFDTIKAEILNETEIIPDGKSNNLKESLDLKLVTGDTNISFSLIKCIIGEEEFTRIKIKDGDDYIVRKSISDWEQLLPEKDFIRVHESSIINMNYIDRIEKWFDNAYMIYLSEISEPFFISKQFVKKNQ